MKIKISEVNISFIKNRDGLIGFASLVINDQLYLSSIGIHKKLNDTGYRLTYPNKFIGNSPINIFHPINREASNAIEEGIFNKLNEVMKNDRHSSSNA